MSAPQRVRGLSGRARLLIYALALAALGIFWPVWRRLLIQALLGALTAWMALPLCRRMEARLPRTVAGALSMAVVLLLIPGLVVLLLPTLYAQASELYALLPGLLERGRLLMEEIQSRVQTLGLPSGDNMADRLLQQGMDALTMALPKAVAFMREQAGALSLFMIAPVLGYYFLRDREAVCARLEMWVPLKYRCRAVRVAIGLRRELAGYFRGQLLISVCVAALTALGLFLVGVPAWLLLGVVMGILETIPYLGPFLGAVPVALFSLPQGTTTMLWALGVVVLVQQIEGSYLSPRLMAESTGLHPISVLCLVSAGGMAAGMAGMLLVLPVAVCLRGAVRAVRAAGDGEPPLKQ